MSDDDIPGKPSAPRSQSLDGKGEKLTRTKEQWARDGRGMSNAPATPHDRLPPGQHLTRDWPVLDLGVQPPIDPQDWRLTVSGLVETPIDWGWEDFHAQPHIELTTDIHCVTTWSRYDNHWQGISARQFLSAVRPKQDARYLVFHCHDGYTTNVPLAKFDDTDVVLAHTWNGEPLSRAHGGPIRPIIPKLYFWKSAKWVKHISFLADDAPGFWEVRGYHNDADPWREERYGSPPSVSKKPYDPWKDE